MYGLTVITPSSGCSNSYTHSATIHYITLIIQT